MLNAKRIETWESDFVFAMSLFLSTSSIDIISVFCFCRNSSIFFRKVFEAVGFEVLGAGCWVVVFLKMGSIEI